MDAMVAAGAVDEVRAAAAAGASPTARRALGFEELLRGDVEAMKRRTRRYARRQLTWMRKLPGVRVIDVTGRDPVRRRRELHAAPSGMIPAVRFEKWQALGNDYLDRRGGRRCPFALTAERVRRLCDRHTGPGADGVLELIGARGPGDVVARLRIFNPDGSEAELSGNGAREAMLYLRRQRLDGARTRFTRRDRRRGRSARRSRAPTPAASRWAGPA